MGILLFDMRAFYCWVSEASEQELMSRRDEAIKISARLVSEDLKKEVSRLVRVIEDEMVARKFRF
jgi:hypothetical protein